VTQNDHKLRMDSQR